MSIGASALVALAVTMTACPLLVGALRRLQVVDRPNGRSLHDTPIPRGGGLAVAGGALIGLALVDPLTLPWRGALLAAALGFGVLGLVEDLRGVPALRRLGLQVLVAAALLPLLLHDLRGPLAWQLVFGVGVLLWLVSYVNAFNFMDGINGVSASQATVAGVAWWAMGRSAEVPALAAGGLIVAGAAAGFAPFNFPRAQVFLGDVGSYLLGAWLAVLVVIALRGGLPLEAAVAPVLVYLADTAATIVRRLRGNEAWYEPHRHHAYQRLVIAGWSHTRTTVLIAGLVAACSALGAVSLVDSPALRAAADVGLVVIVAAYLSVPSRVSHHSRSVVPAT
ncbi:MAG: glycosyl transferase [Actinomycetota bacterium]|nr:glycosyl transferase [Actinomycetota bacterium]